MQVMYQRCCGLDIGKREVVCCLFTPDEKGKVIKEFRKFGTTTFELHALRDWLKGAQCEHAAMESTGSYWKPIWNVLEGQLGLT